jgi:uncharacterized phage protein (TIGR02218 family)
MATEGFDSTFDATGFHSHRDAPPVYTTWMGSITTFVGQIASVEQTGRSQVKFIVADMLYVLNRQTPPNVLQSGCRFMLFDVNCAAANGAYLINTTVTAGSGFANGQTNFQLYTTETLQFMVGSLASPYYSLGTVKFTSGQNKGLLFSIKAQLSANQLQLSAPTPFPVSIGDAITILPGCDKSMATCQNKFGNLIHFGGAPFIPNPEVAA